MSLELGVPPSSPRCVRPLGLAAPLGPFHERVLSRGSVKPAPPGAVRVLNMEKVTDPEAGGA